MGIRQDIVRVINLEIDTLKDLIEVVDQSFEDAVRVIMQAPRKIIVCGMGKSGHIANKIAATLSSTGTPAVGMHPAESMHGDLGIVENGDVLILLSKSGESEEMIGMLPTLRKLECRTILITANPDSALAKHANIVLNTPVRKEACILDLAPTCSTTAALVAGDALAVSLMSLKNFSKEDFALFHPAGRIGKRLLFKVEDLMRGGEENPVVGEHDRFEDIVKVISKGGANAVSVADEKGKFTGLITGFDLRTAFQSDQDLKNLKAYQMMHTSPVTIEKGAFAMEALDIMKNNPKPLLLLPVLEKGQSIGVITLQDMIRAGL